MDGKQAINYLKSSGMSDEQIVTVVDAFTRELSEIKKILDDSEMDFRMHVPTNNEELIYMPLNYILDDYLEMIDMLWDIQRIIDEMKGEHNEL
jgi:hypothetical protein